MTDYSALVERYGRERESYAALAADVASLLSSAFHGRGINHRVEHRAKETSSLVKKVFVKGRTYEEIPDKAGARAVLAMPQSREPAIVAIRETFAVQKFEDKRAALDADRFGYGGMHFDVKLKSGLDLVCEIQLHTPGESLWASGAHDLTYKTLLAPPADVMRTVYRMRALSEIFDSEMERAASMLDAIGDPKSSAVLRELEPWFFRVAQRTYKPDLSLLIVQRLTDAVQGDPSQIGSFCDEQQERMRGIYSRYSAALNPCLSQPEAMLIFYLLEHDEYSVRAAWDGLPVEWLTELESIWGVPSAID